MENINLKKVLVIIIKKALKIFNIFPIRQNRISIMSYHGTGYSCNPKYISEYLYEKNKKFEIIWAFSEPNKYKPMFPDDIKIVRYKSLPYIYYTLTAQFRITNAEEWVILPKRKKQMIMNTWHGLCYKKVGYDSEFVDGKLNAMDYYNISTLFLSPCEANTNIMCSAFHYFGEVLKCGSPRNDILVNENQKVYNTLKKSFGLSSDSKVVLYAPTFREGSKSDLRPMDGEALRKALSMKLGGEWYLFARKHQATSLGIGANNFFTSLGEYRDVSDYSDMQELLLIADVLVTDYSSSIWDYSFTKRPIFLYVPDLLRYSDKERGFYKEIDSWGFPICKTNTELENAVEAFDKTKCRRAIELHHAAFGSYEDGHATEKVCQYINNYSDNTAKRRGRYYG